MSLNVGFEARYYFTLSLNYIITIIRKLLCKSLFTCFLLPTKKKLKICVEHFFWHIMKKLQCKEVKKLKMDGLWMNVSPKHKNYDEKKNLQNAWGLKWTMTKTFSLNLNPTMKHDN